MLPALVVSGGQGHGSGSANNVEIISLYRDLAPRLLHRDINLKLADIPHNEFHTMDKNIICGGDRMRNKCVKLQQNGGETFCNLTFGDPISIPGYIPSQVSGRRATPCCSLGTTTAAGWWRTASSSSEATAPSPPPRLPSGGAEWRSCSA